MAKTIHIHLHGLARITKRTGDAGNFDESKHKRDDDGKFSSGGGGGGKKEPQTAAGKREAARRAAFRAEADKNAQAGVAKFDLASLKHVLQRPHQQLTVGRYGSTTPERGSKPTRGAQNLGGFGGGKAPEKSGAELASPSPWPKNEHGNPAPPVGAKVTNPNAGMAAPGTVRSVTGNVATVAFQVKGPDGKMYNRQQEFHVTKLFPADKQQAAPSGKMPSVKARGFTATAEPSQFGGFRAKLLNDDGSLHRLTQQSFKTPEEAMEHAEQIALGNRK